MAMQQLSEKGPRLLRARPDYLTIQAMYSVALPLSLSGHEKERRKKSCSHLRAKQTHQPAPGQPHATLACLATLSMHLSLWLGVVGQAPPTFACRDA